jgi:hypothetical protein
MVTTADPEPRSRTGRRGRVVAGALFLAFGLASLSSVGLTVSEYLGEWLPTRAYLATETLLYLASSALAGVGSLVSGTFARGPEGVANRSLVVTLLFIATSAMFGVVAFFQVFAAAFATAIGSSSSAFAEQAFGATAVLYLVILLTAIALAIWGAGRGVARWVMFAPVLGLVGNTVLSVLATSPQMLYAAQTLEPLGWVLVGVVFLLSRSRRASVSV